MSSSARQVELVDGSKRIATIRRKRPISPQVKTIQWLGDVYLQRADNPDIYEKVPTAVICSYDVERA